MKIAPLVEALEQREIPQFLVHTGQHYDTNMSAIFFDELGLPRPDIYLGVGSGSHARQTASIMTAFEEIAEQRRPDLLVVCGDVNSTIATALVAAKMTIPIAHVEAGLRSFDRAMPEEINRVLTDHLSDLLFTTEPGGGENLLKEGIAAEKIHHVGNCMVDTLLKHVDSALLRAPWSDFDVQPGEYALLTLHRPSNVDERETLAALMAVINAVAEQIPVLFPVHPRTRTRLKDWNIATAPDLRLEDPLPYLAFLGLMAKARCVLTDSGGIQEETTALGVPCLTLRWNTERPITINEGTNRLVGTDREQILNGVAEILSGNWRQGTRPALWDGRAGERIAAIIQAYLSQRG
jgi:UDP-N-acetylglucosamine 2-epimerase (non-hydrolysing)